MGNKSKYRIVDIKQKLNNEQEKHVWKLQKKNIFGKWKDMKHNRFEKYDNGTVFYFYYESSKTYFEDMKQAITYLKELIEFETFKKNHYGKSPAYVFGTLDTVNPKSHDVLFVPLDIFSGKIKKILFEKGDEPINELGICHSKAELYQRMNYILGNQVKEEKFLYLYDNNIHEDGECWTIV